ESPTSVGPADRIVDIVGSRIAAIAPRSDRETYVESHRSIPEWSIVSAGRIRRASAQEEPMRAALATVDPAKAPPAAVIIRGSLARKTSEPQGILLRLAKGEELFAEGEPAEYFYKIVSGTVRSCKLLTDGRRQIDAFHLAGDIFGIETGVDHRFSVEAICSATV